MIPIRDPIRAQCPRSAPASCRRRHSVIVFRWPATDRIRQSTPRGRRSELGECSIGDPGDLHFAEPVLRLIAGAPTIIGAIALSAKGDASQVRRAWTSFGPDADQAQCSSWVRCFLKGDPREERLTTDYVEELPALTASSRQRRSISYRRVRRRGCLARAISQKSGSHLTRRWSKRDSNSQSHLGKCRLIFADE
jgi:hypothetical protein